MDPSKSIVLIKCSFDPDQFEPHHFQQLNIELPAELKNSVPKRLSEFLSGRYISEQALKRLGHTKPMSIKVGKNREPIWPLGYRGSITHSNNKALCVIGKSCTTSFIGVDIENILTDTASDEISSQIHTNSELRLFLSSGIARGIATTIIFSAKESLFKALYPYVKVYFDFNYAQLIKIDIINQQLTLQLKPSFCSKHQLKDIYEIFFEYNQSSVITILIE